MDMNEVRARWSRDGFVVLPGFLPAEDLASAQAGLEVLHPTAAGFHDGLDPRGRRYVGDEFAGIDAFPFASPELSLLAVHPRLTDLAAALAGDDELRMYQAEVWAKYTGAADYDQDLHRDYLNHTVLVPTVAAGYRQVEMFLYLCDVPQDLGPPHLVPREHTRHLPARPNWYLRPGADPGGVPDDDLRAFVAAGDTGALYDAEVSAAGPAGTVVAFGLDTFHRGTALARPRGARFTMHVNYRPASADWALRGPWADRSHDSAWYRFVERATANQLALFGFPPPGHPFWNPDTLRAMAQRYPTLDLSPWERPLLP
ncbi:phytanoyl-CoA dioxygenase family protein [Embleya scabrispora]|nr:phytanoyl-CoA dioxygenase family protein [Embleya scabrispora]